MPKIRLTQTITLRSELLTAGTEVETDAITCQQLIAAGQAEAIAPVAVVATKTKAAQE